MKTGRCYIHVQGIGSADDSNYYPQNFLVAVLGHERSNARGDASTKQGHSLRNRPNFHRLSI